MEIGAKVANAPWPSQRTLTNRSRQLGAFHFCFLEHRDILVRVAPESEKLPVGSLRPSVISRQRESSAQLQVHQRANGIGAHDTAVIEDSFFLGG